MVSTKRLSINTIRNRSNKKYLKNPLTGKNCKSFFFTLYLIERDIQRNLENFGEI